MKTVLAINLNGFFCFIIYIPIYCYLHEFAGHYTANWLSGIPAEQMEIEWFTLFNKKLCPLAVDVVNGVPPRISSFAGGFVAGLFYLIATSIFWKIYKKKRQERYWWFFTINLAFSFVGFTEFIIEGFFPEYHRDILETVILLFFVLIPAPLLSVWHYLKFRVEL